MKRRFKTYPLSENRTAKFKFRMVVFTFCLYSTSSCCFGSSLPELETNNNLLRSTIARQNRTIATLQHQIRDEEDVRKSQVEVLRNQIQKLQIEADTRSATKQSLEEKIAQS